MSLFDKVKGWFGAESPAAPKAPAAPETDTARASHDEEPTPPSAPERRAGKWQPKRRTTPEDDALLEREGRALFEANNAADAIALLSTRGIMFARHDAAGLPCLCRRCLRPEVDTAERSGIRYLRDFVVTKHRVFFYWMPTELAPDRKQMRASMRAEVRQRLRALAKEEDRPRTAINPFTKEPIEIPAKPEPRPPINPFTGKPVP